MCGTAIAMDPAGGVGKGSSLPARNARHEAREFVIHWYGREVSKRFPGVPFTSDDFYWGRMVSLCGYLVPGAWGMGVLKIVSENVDLN